MALRFSTVPSYSVAYCRLRAAGLDFPQRTANACPTRHTSATELALVPALAFLLAGPISRAVGALRAAADVLSIHTVCFACLGSFVVLSCHFAFP